MNDAQGRGGLPFMIEDSRPSPAVRTNLLQSLPAAVWRSTQGWRPTILGSMWIESLLCLLYIYDLYLVGLSR